MRKKGAVYIVERPIEIGEKGSKGERREAEIVLIHVLEWIYFKCF